MPRVGVKPTPASSPKRHVEWPSAEIRRINGAVIVHLESVVKEFPGGDTPLRVLDGLEFSLAEGEAVSVVGASGCGKSTFLNIVGTLDRPTSGRVEVFGTDVGAAPEPVLADLRARHIGFVFQLHHLLPQCSVLENVLVPTLALPKGEGGDAERARELLEKVGMGHRIAHLPGQLSGGERQRVAVVRALINQPKLILADEPTGALDPRTAADLADLLMELNRDHGVALVMVTHDQSLAGRLESRYRIEHGRLSPA